MIKIYEANEMKETINGTPFIFDSEDNAKKLCNDIVKFIEDETRLDINIESRTTKDIINNFKNNQTLDNFIFSIELGDYEIQIYNWYFPKSFEGNDFIYEEEVQYKPIVVLISYSSYNGLATRTENGIKNIAKKYGYDLFY